MKQMIPQNNKGAAESSVKRSRESYRLRHVIVHFNTSGRCDLITRASAEWYMHFISVVFARPKASHLVMPS